MQGNGFKIFLTVFFLLVTGYYLWPSAQNLYYNQRMGDMEAEARQEYERENFARLREVKEKALKLGLDLLGGMHVTLEVGVESLIRELSRETDEVFEEVLTVASGRAAREGASVIDAFVDEFESRDENARLSRYFRNDDEGITRRSTNVEVASYLRGEADAAVTRAIEIIRDRVDRYGVTEPSIQKQGSRRVIVEMPRRT
jgi:preprotein translocase subunit SecD